MLPLAINQQLSQLQAWQQSVFCMALAQHNITHFSMFCEAIGSEENKVAANILQLFWEKMTVKGAKVNLTIQEENFDTIIPESKDHDFYGVYPAVDFCVIMSCIFNSFSTKSKEEALNASQTCFSTVASFIELQSGEEINAQELQQEPLFLAQLSLQETLLDMLNNERSPALIKQVRQYIQSQEATSLGISILL